MKVRAGWLRGLLLVIYFLGIGPVTLIGELTHLDFPRLSVVYLCVMILSSVLIQARATQLRSRALQILAMFVTCTSALASITAPLISTLNFYALLAYHCVPLMFIAAAIASTTGGSARIIIPLGMVKAITLAMLVLYPLAPGGFAFKDLGFGNALWDGRYLGMLAISIWFLLPRNLWSISIFLFLTILIYSGDVRQVQLALPLTIASLAFLKKFHSPFPLFFTAVSMTGLGVILYYTLGQFGLITDATDLYRLRFIDVTLAATRESPLFGASAEGKAFYDAFSSMVYSRLQFTYPHNTVLSVTYYFGLVGLVAYSLLTFLIFSRLKAVDKWLAAIYLYNLIVAGFSGDIIGNWPLVASGLLIIILSRREANHGAGRMGLASQRVAVTSV